MAQTAVLDDKPLWMQPVDGDSSYPDGIQYPARVIRRQDERPVYGEGVLAENALLVHERDAGANFTVEVDPGPYAVRGDDVANQGMYQGDSPSKESLDVPAAPSSGTVTHRVVCRVRDKLHNSTWSDYDAAVQLLEDTGSGTPPVPDTAFHLAKIAVSSTTSAITNSEITNDPPRGDQHGSTHAISGTDSGPHGEELIEQQTLPDGGKLTFSNIPQQYRNLLITWDGKSGGGATDYVGMYLRINGDNGNNYTSYVRGFPGGGSGIQEQDPGQVSILRFGYIGTSWRNSGSLMITAYSVNRTKGCHASGMAINNQDGGQGIMHWLGGGIYNQSAAVTEIFISNIGEYGFEDSTEFSLYGLR